MSGGIEETISVGFGNVREERAVRRKLLEYIRGGSQALGEGARGRFPRRRTTLCVIAHVLNLSSAGVIATALSPVFHSCAWYALCLTGGETQNDSDIQTRGKS